MLTRILHTAGIMACIIMIMACFLPWTYHADINETFTGLYSYKNQYGRPGKFIILMTSIILLFTLLPKVWAKRTNLFLGALLLGYAIKTYVLFSSCYNAYCPEKKSGLILMLSMSIVILISVIFPKMNIKKEA